MLVIVAPSIGPARYGAFSVFWGALFMVVGVLFGLQQETTRAVSVQRREPARALSAVSLLRFALLIAFALFGLLAATGVFWSDLIFGPGYRDWVLPLGIAVSSYVLIAVVNGILAGTNGWVAFSVLPIIDGVLRFLLVVAVLNWDLGMGALAWAVALPFPVSLICVWAWQRRRIQTQTKVNERYRVLAANSARTMVASLATALLVNGFPVVLAVFGSGSEAEIGALVLALTLTRAPILVPLTALQSFFISRMSAVDAHAMSFALKVVGIIASVTVAVAFVVAAVGESIIGWAFGEGFAVSGILLAGLVIASGCLGVLTLTGAYVLASGKHTVFAAGWVTAAVISVVGIATLPGALSVKAILALLAGPLAGVVVHLVWGKRRAVGVVSS